MGRRRREPLPDGTADTASGRYRMQIDLHAHEDRELKKFIDDGGASNQAEAVRAGLALIKVVGPPMRAGSELILRDPDGRETRIILARS